MGETRKAGRVLTEPSSHSASVQALPQPAPHATGSPQTLLTEQRVELCLASDRTAVRSINDNIKSTVHESNLLWSIGFVGFRDAGERDKS